MLNLVASADTLHTQCSLQLGEWEGMNAQKRWCWMNWSPASGSHEDELMQMQPPSRNNKLGELLLLIDRTPAAESGAGRGWGDT